MSDDERMRLLQALMDTGCKLELRKYRDDPSDDKDKDLENEQRMCSIAGYIPCRIPCKTLQ